MLLLRRRLKNLHFPARFHHHHHYHYHYPNRIFPKLPLSSLSSAQSQTTTSSDPTPKPSSLSARMSFVFEQIDAIEKERSQKDQTLQRIRAWRESKKQQQQPTTDLSPAEAELSEKKLELKKDENEVSPKNAGGLLDGKIKEVELVHPWPEWIELMERLVQQNYFDHKRRDEDGMMETVGFNLSEMVEEEGFDFTRDFKTVQTAVLNFGRDRFDILRSMSRQDLQILVGYGCPSVDKKVVFSAKLLRKHVHLDEGDVCSSCSLRSSCERAYLLTNKEDEARTMDVMRMLLTYGFDAVNGSVANKSLMKMKTLKTVVRKLIHDVVKLSAVPIDPNLPPPVIKKPPPKVKQPPPPPKKRVGRDDIEMKKGDWLCVKCDFMNFAKNTVCLQCDAKRPKRQLLPGEWECPQCNFLNYRRNMVCFHCEHKRPPDEFMESQVQDRQHSPRRLENISSRPEISNAWNFDFDDNESDGADVAAFEYADSKKMHEDFPSDKQPHAGVARACEDGLHKDYRSAKDTDPVNPGFGFNDFDDEDDDVENYELDTQNDAQKASTVDFSELDVDSYSEDEDRTGHDWTLRRKSNFQAQNKPSKSTRRGVGFSGSDPEIDFGTDDELPIHPNWKSSHVNQRSKRRGGMSFGSDDEVSSGTEYANNDFGSRQMKGNKWKSSRSSRKQNSFDSDDEPFSDLESNNDKDKFGSRKASLNSQRNTSNGRRNRDMGNLRGSSRDSPKRFEDTDYGHRKYTRDGRSQNFRSPQREGSFKQRRDKRFEDDDNGYRSDSRGGRSQNFRSSSREGSHKQRQGRYGNYNKSGDSYLDDERHRRPRVNVR
ncbi:uncharacterized protein LOC113760227 [Coffea eugenioides]|uniref:uncharacterized protein LOC113760227 n=1 Tax=Coffea eugenioides TaxID=49369 RepID=UPI000F60917F|nr:uncharacterized protein LOC113760227 [Coffea eugenioides]